MGDGGIGNGGNLNVVVETIELNNSQIVNPTFGSGKGGDLFIRASSIDAGGQSDDGFFTSQIGTSTFSTGNTGNTNISTERLRLRGGAQIFSGSFGQGNAGNITLNAESVEVIGLSQGSQSVRSAISTSVLESSSDDPFREESGLGGKGGNITLNVGKLTLREGGGIFANTFGPANAGNIAIQAREVDAIGSMLSSSSIIVDSGITTNGFVGNGGNIQLSAERLSVVDGAVISASTDGMGNAGNITLQGGKIEVRGTTVNDSSHGCATLRERKYRGRVLKLPRGSRIGQYRRRATAGIGPGGSGR